MVIWKKNIKAWLLLLLMVVTPKVLLAQSADTDADGVLDTADLCPGTPSGVAVNAYGCPINQTTCDYTVGNFTLSTVGAVPVETRYLLVNSQTGIITQISNTPSFSGLTGTNTYMVLAFSYNGVVSGLAVGNQLSSVAASCKDFSNAVMVKVCVAAALPSVSIQPNAVVGESAGTVTLTLTLSNTSASNVSVNYNTTNGTALAGTDYTTTAGIITFLPGETSKTITIPILSDSSPESSENFNVSLSNPSGATISSGVSVVSVTDDDIDTDSDGILDTKDLCPNTPLGTQVNVYGCPVIKNVCDFTTSTISFQSTARPVGKITKYILADVADGRIIQIVDSPTFTALTGTNTYMVLALSYENDNSITNLSANSLLSQVSASCFDWSNALVVRVCVQESSPICDFYGPTITLKTNTAPPTGGTTQFILADTEGNITNVSNTTTFTGLSGNKDLLAYAVSFTGTLSGLTVGSKVANIQGSCFDLSNPLSIRVCICKPDICIPISITKVKSN
ncbi:MAG: Calx-beta domain-containing protein [Flavobacterium sp.]